MEVLRDIINQLQPCKDDVLIEFGGGIFSTPVLLNSGANLHTIEQGRNTTPAINSEWMLQLQEMWRNWANWTLIDSPSTSAWRYLYYPAEVLFCFVDGHGDCRKEVVEFMLAKGIKVIAAHDSESAFFRYDQLLTPNEYSVHDYFSREVWTRVWSKEPQITALLDRNQNYRRFIQV